jgi:uncharacterized protein YndB with AHSA1/START domain
MKYEHEITIDLPRERVIELFDNPDNMRHWQPGLVSFEHLSGEPGTPGAKSLLKYDMGKRKIEMVETVTKRNLPQEFSGTYETKGVWNQVENFFEEVDQNTTRWRSVNEFRCSGFMKLMTWLMPGAFKKQSLTFMNDFKKFAESQ